MVICKYFQRGYCRFGSKCNNEHFDIKQVLKNDVEGACNGKQWPLTCYGPFKDKPCIPNFNVDQSYEEVRFLCYESKKNNFFDQYNQQFQSQIMEATNKMKALLQLTPEIIELVCNVYDMPDSSLKPANAINSNNPFGNTNTGTANSVFGNLNTNNNNNICAAGKLFGGVNTNKSGSIFAGSSTINATGGGIFGGGMQNVNPIQQQQQTTLNFSQNQNNQGNSIFGGGSQTSLFPSTMQPLQTTSSGIFSQGNQQLNSNMGANNVTSGGIFAQASQQMQQPQPHPGNFGLFSQNAQQSNNFVQTTSIFGGQSSQQQFQQQQQQQFQQPPQQQSSLIFSKPAPQGGNSYNNQIGLQQNVTPFANSSVFGSQGAQGQTGPPNQIFGQAMQQNFPQQQLQQQQQQQQQEMHVSGVQSQTVYSLMENITPKEIEAFKADRFEVGNLPFSPPPRELIN